VRREGAIVDTPVSSLLDTKGRQVITVAPDRSLADAAEVLSAAGIGALVVTSGGDRIEGMLSERDIVRQVAEHGAAGLRVTVAEAMSSPAVTCGPDTTAGQLMALMTERRFRHVPVEAEGRLVGIVSIGDVVRSRIEGLEQDQEQLRAYVSGSY
jgi:CBS domain-containing protein